MHRMKPLILICVQFEKLLEPMVWIDAACQVFFSLSLGMGGIIAMASFSPRKNNCMRDAILMTICNYSTGLLAASIIFSILGNKAYETAGQCLSECGVTFLVSVNVMSVIVPNLQMRFDNYKSIRSTVNFCTKTLIFHFD